MPVLHSQKYTNHTLAVLSVQRSRVARTICKKLNKDKLPETARYMQTLRFYEYIMISRQSIMKYKWEAVWSVTGTRHWFKWTQNPLTSHSERQHWPASFWPSSTESKGPATYTQSLIYEGAMWLQICHLHCQTHLWDRVSNKTNRGDFLREPGPIRSAKFSVGFNSRQEHTRSAFTRPWVQTMSRWLKLNPAGLLAL